MDIKNKLYKNIGIHVITVIFTIENGMIKVLLVKRKNEPFKGEWILTGGALYNNERLEDGAKREIFEKTGIKDINIYQFKLFDEIKRSPLLRMVAVGYIGVIDCERVKILRNTEKTSNADWFLIDKVPKLGYDHKHILNEAIVAFRNLIVKTDILKALFPNDFTLPELYKVYESILKRKIDRRNFRKKLLNMKLIVYTNKVRHFAGKKPAKLYRFNEKHTGSENIF